MHYGWVVVAAGALTIFACIGLGRFGLGMLLPSMGRGLGLDYAQMGFISTGNLVAYLVAVYAVRLPMRRFGARRTTILGLGLVALSMMLVGTADSFAAALVLFTSTGIGSGLANVPVMALVSHWFARHHRGKAAGFMVLGNGPAIIYAGSVVPFVNAAVGVDGWRFGWLLLGATALAAAVVAALLLRNHPSDMALSAVGEERQPTVSGRTGEPPGRDRPAATSRKVIAYLGLIYALFGASYVIYMTFIVTSLVDDRGFSEAAAGRFWAWLGAASLLSGPLFGALSDRIGRRAGLALVFALQTTAYGLAAAPLADAFVYPSLLLYGVTAWSVPSIMAAAVGDYVGAARAGEAFGTITVIFGLGQILGPMVAGVAAEASGGFAASFAIAAALAAVAIGLSLLLRPPASPA